jgi:ERF superfamily
LFGKGINMKVYQRLNEARNQFHKLKLKKTGLNKFAGYQYFELSDFLIPALEVFKENGLCAFISFGEALATMTIVDIADGSSIQLTSPMAEAQLKGCHPIQNLGAVETYTRRYLWVAALEIVEHDAIDSSPKLKGDGPVITPRGGIGDDLPEEDKEFLRDLAASTTELVDKGQAKDALAMLQEQGLDGDQRIWLDSQLPSNVRSALKKAKQS